MDIFQKVPADIQIEIALWMTFSQLKPFLHENDFLGRLGIVPGTLYLWKSEWIHVPCRLLSVAIHDTHLSMAILPEEEWQKKRHRSITIESPVEFHRLLLPLHAKVYPHVVSVTPTDIVVHMGRTFYPSPPSLTVGSVVDAMDTYGVWYEAVVVNVSPPQHDRVLVHFQGWDDNWNTWFPTTSKHLAPHRTFTKPWREQLEMHDLLEIRDQGRWHRARVQGILYTEEEIFISWYVRQYHSILFHSRWIHRNDPGLQPIGMHTHAYPREGGYQYRYFCFQVWPPSPLTMDASDQPLFLRMDRHTQNFSLF
jgi:hypothetical protein